MQLEGLSEQDALAGARDIVAQTWAEEAQVRKRAREGRFLRRVVMLASKERKKGADKEGNYKTYHEYSRALNIVPPHAILALARAEREKILSLKAHFLTSPRYIGKVVFSGFTEEIYSVCERSLLTLILGLF